MVPYGLTSHNFTVVFSSANTLPPKRKTDKAKPDNQINPLMAGLQSSIREQHNTRSSPVCLATALEFDKTPVGTSGIRHQRIVTANVSNFAVFQKHDAIRLADGGEPMGDNDHQTTFGRAL